MLIIRFIYSILPSRRLSKRGKIKEFRIVLVAATPFFLSYIGDFEGQGFLLATEETSSIKCYWFFNFENILSRDYAK